MLVYDLNRSVRISGIRLFHVTANQQIIVIIQTELITICGIVNSIIPRLTRSLKWNIILKITVLSDYVTKPQTSA